MTASANCIALVLLARAALPAAVIVRSAFRDAPAAGAPPTSDSKQTLARRNSDERAKEKHAAEQELKRARAKEKYAAEQELKRARDQEIYRRHWAPLQPPPGHHPGIAPSQADHDMAQALQAPYVQFWRSLPKFEPSLRLQDVQRAPYFKLQNWRSPAELVTRPARPGDNESLYILCHHKTGQKLRGNMADGLPPGRFRVELQHEIVPNGTYKIAEGWRRLHMVRDPVDVIASGYRYHQFRWGTEVWSWGHMALQDPICFECDDEDHDTIFDTCHQNCTYFELVNRLDETAGIVTEAVSARHTLTSMASLMSLLANDTKTLHLSFDLFKANYTQTTACMLKFLGLEGDKAQLDKMLHEEMTVRDPHHITSGQYDNAALKAFLRNHPVWGPEFREVKELMDGIFRRQAALWGCPEREAEVED